MKTKPNNWLRKLLRLPEQNSGETLTQTTQLRIEDTDGIRKVVRAEMARMAANANLETFEEADDFDLDDGDEWVSPYEEMYEPEPSVEPKSGEGRSPSDTSSTADQSATNGTSSNQS